MKTIISFLLLLAAASLTATAPSEAARKGFQQDQKRIALVIGMSAYEEVPALPNPRADAEAVAEALARLDFEVIKRIDPDHTELEAVLDEFDSRLSGTDIGILYYAGHSIQVDGENFLIPTDAKFENAEDFDTYLVSVDRITRLMDRKASVRLIILDACRDNPFLVTAREVADGDTKRSINPGLANISGPEAIDAELDTQVYGSVVAYAASSGRTASDGESEHSPYTEALLAHIEQPGLEIGQMFRNVAGAVIKSTNGSQHPEYLVRLTDEVYFKLPQPSDCDFLAAAPYNSIGVTGVDFERVDTRKAIPACRSALEEEPDHPRLLFNLARALDADRQFAEAVRYYEQSANLGYPAALSSLGVMYVNGQGTEQDFQKGVTLLKQAKALGSRTASISLSSSDFSVLFEKPEFEAVQRSLKKEGFYSGSVDGDYGPITRNAVSAYQALSRLSKNGLTLETLDSLGLVEIIPSYELN